MLIKIVDGKSAEPDEKYYNEISISDEFIEDAGSKLFIPKDLKNKKIIGF